MRRSRLDRYQGVGQIIAQGSKSLDSKQPAFDAEVTAIKEAFLELSGVGRVMADGTDEGGARAARMDEWVVWETAHTLPAESALDRRFLASVLSAAESTPRRLLLPPPGRRLGFGRSLVFMLVQLDVLPRKLSEASTEVGTAHPHGSPPHSVEFTAYFASRDLPRMDRRVLSALSRVRVCGHHRRRRSLPSDSAVALLFRTSSSCLRCRACRHQGSPLLGTYKDPLDI
jgi:hypothetical protein